MSQIRIVMELPHYSETCGGIRDNIRIAEDFFPQMYLRFQNISNGYPFVHVPFTVGMPDKTFPECDICITYSDNPYLERLVNLPQIGRVFILMLSYGMNLPVERRNIHNKKVTVLCSTMKLEKAIRAEGVKVIRLGVGLDMSAFYLTNPYHMREKYMAILYHDMPSKEYKLAVEVANVLSDMGVINGVVTFGRTRGYDKAIKPKKLIKHFPDATPEQVNNIFNSCRCFLMPSSSEGLNLTPIEATLCGCPAILCDGAIGEVFIDHENCFIVPKGNRLAMVNRVMDTIEWSLHSEAYMLDMQATVAGMSWDKVLTNLKEALCL